MPSISAPVYSTESVPHPPVVCHLVTCQCTEGRCPGWLPLVSLCQSGLPRASSVTPAPDSCDCPPDTVTPRKNESVRNIARNRRISSWSSDRDARCESGQNLHQNQDHDTSPRHSKIPEKSKSRLAGCAFQPRQDKARLTHHYS